MGDARAQLQPDQGLDRTTSSTGRNTTCAISGYLDGKGADTHLSQQGRHAREQIEVATDEQMRRALRALGSDIEELFDILAPWGEAIRAGKGYLGAGPHDLG